MIWHFRYFCFVCEWQLFLQFIVKLIVITKENFGDVSIPEGFQLPSAQKLNQLSKRSNGVSSSVVVILDSKTIFLPGFSYDGLGNGKTHLQSYF